MSAGRSTESLRLLERLELKFHIPETMVEPISEFVSIYCSPDKYSRDAEGGVYTVNSLYLDSPNFLFLRRRLDGSANRINMRVRSYGDAGELPFFLEINTLPTFAPDGSFGILAELEGRPLEALLADVLGEGLARLGIGS